MGTFYCQNDPENGLGFWGSLNLILSTTLGMYLHSRVTQYKYFSQKYLSHLLLQLVLFYPHPGNDMPLSWFVCEIPNPVQIKRKIRNSYYHYCTLLIWCKKSDTCDGLDSLFVILSAFTSHWSTFDDTFNIWSYDRCHNTDLIKDFR